MREWLSERLRYSFLVLVLGFAPGVFAAEDYLDTELRAAVTQLQQDVAQPTTLANYPERSDLLWRWANAFAVSVGICAG